MYSIRTSTEVAVLGVVGVVEVLGVFGGIAVLGVIGLPGARVTGVLITCTDVEG